MFTISPSSPLVDFDLTSVIKDEALTGQREANKNSIKAADRNVFFTRRCCFPLGFISFLQPLQDSSLLHSWKWLRLISWVLECERGGGVMPETGAQRAKSTVNHARSQRVAPSSLPRLSCSTPNPVGSPLPDTRWALSRTDGKNPTHVSCWHLVESKTCDSNAFFAYSASLVWFALWKLLFSLLPTCSEIIWYEVWKLHSSKRIIIFLMIIKRLILFQVSSCFTLQLIRVLYCWTVSESIQPWTVLPTGPCLQRTARANIQAGFLKGGGCRGWGRSTMCNDLFLLFFFKDSHSNDTGEKSPNSYSQAPRICLLLTAKILAWEK